MKQKASFLHEKIYWTKGYHIIGIDEVGRGAFAGPLFVAGVGLPPTLTTEKISYLESLGINDSKLLTKKKRETLSAILKNELPYALAKISVADINTYGIAPATQAGMKYVAKKLAQKIDGKVFLLTDAFLLKEDKEHYFSGQLPLIHGDQISISIACASIIAKVARDTFMTHLAANHPLYGFDAHKGYGTKFHQEALIKYGPSSEHRTQFISKTLNRI